MTPDLAEIRGLWARREWHRLVPVMQEHMVRIMPSQARHDADLMEELCQRALIRMWSCPYIPEDPRAWMNRVLRNLVYDVAKHSSEKFRSTNVDINEIEQYEEHPDERLERLQSLGRLREALRSLPDHLRRCLVLHDLHGKTCAEVGMQVGINEGAVKMRLHRARRMLGMIYLATPTPPLDKHDKPAKKRGRPKLMTWAVLTNVP